MQEVKEVASLADFNTLVEARRSYRVFDTGHEMPEEVVQQALEAALKSPNSSNMQMWEFVRVRSAEMKKEMQAVCLNQSAAKTASEFVVVVGKMNDWKNRAGFNYRKLEEEYGADSQNFQRVKGYYGKIMPMVYRNDYFGLLGRGKKIMANVTGLFKPMVRELGKSDIAATVHGSNSLASMTFMYAMKAQGYDTCPLGGFDSSRLKKLLKLKSSDEVTMVIACGKGKQEGVWGKRHRIPYQEVVKTV